ncbi:hypothetical protein [Pseudogemmobacter humi]|uniref:Uncharacterized protein n=1 Tax=Pseudogemmobacter humi TaxID=2483812 RepID=A0A3P5XQW4_9RHOB|nr:hypothetical protein [Pseudogemmobacter humi]VDC34021.1 hypothetical protein XINFAN_04219 [Pseudogemmobacter humi]
MSNKCVLPLTAVIAIVATGAGACTAPERPWLPTDPNDMREFVDLLQGDYERYWTDVEGYIRCLDAERARVFEEARDVSNEYGRFLDQTRTERERRASQ